jgi:hypothetical protein
MLEVQVKALNLWSKALDTLFDDLTEWGADLGNFMGEINEQLSGAAGEIKEAATWLEQAISIADQILAAMQRTGTRSVAVERDIARLKQIEFQLELKILEVKLRELNLWTSAMTALFDRLRAWASNIANFVKEINDQLDVAPPSRSGPSRKDRRREVEDFLRGYELTDFQNALYDLRQSFVDIAKTAQGTGIDMERIWAAQAKAIKDLIFEVFQPVEDYLKELRGGADTPAGFSGQFAEAQAEYQRLSALARQGDVEAIQALPAAAQNLLELGKQFGTSSGFYRTLFMDITTNLEDILSQRDEILDEIFTPAQQAQIEELEKHSDLLTQIKDIMAMNIRPSDSGSGGGGGGGNTGNVSLGDELRRYVTGKEVNVLKNRLSAYGFSGNVTMQQLLEAMEAGLLHSDIIGTLRAMGVPGFAAGGSLRRNFPAIVGERGPELILPKYPGNVIPFPQMRDMMGGGESSGQFSEQAILQREEQKNLSTEQTEELKSLRSEVAGLRRDLRAVVGGGG